MGPYSVNLHFEYTPNTVVVPSYRLLVEVTSAQNMSEKIFVFRRTTDGTNIFESVATPEQLTSVPVDNPDPESLYPHKFRTDSVEIKDEDPEVVYEAKTDIQAAADRLTVGLTKSERLNIVEDVTIGILGYSHSSSSLLSE